METGGTGRGPEAPLHHLVPCPPRSHPAATDGARFRREPNFDARQAEEPTFEARQADELTFDTHPVPARSPPVLPSPSPVFPLGPLRSPQIAPPHLQRRPTPTANLPPKG